MVYTTQGTCSRQITFDVVDNKLTNVRFLGGCSGNTQGVARLVEGMDVMRRSAVWKAFSAAPVLPHVLTSWHRH